MKKIFVAAFAAVSMTAFAQGTRPYEFEAEPSCIWKADSARCVVKNKFKDTITCKVEIAGRTAKGVRVGNVRTVLIPAGMYDDSARVYSSVEDNLTTVSATAHCRVE